MPVVIDGACARIEGTARVEEAEALVAFLEGGAGRTLDLGPCRHLHSAVLQVLIAYRPPLAALPEDQPLRAVLEPLLGKAFPDINRAA